jgi:hypothetical protein
MDMAVFIEALLKMAGDGHLVRLHGVRNKRYHEFPCMKLMAVNGPMDSRQPSIGLIQTCRIQKARLAANRKKRPMKTADDTLQ